MPKSNSTNSDVSRENYDRLRPHSVAAAAQLLELWTTGRAVLNQDEVEHCLYVLQGLDMAVATLYDQLFMKEKHA